MAEPAVGSRHHLYHNRDRLCVLGCDPRCLVPRRVVGYAISRSIDARLAVAALKAAISARNPPRGCVHHSDRGSQYASEDYRAVLQKHGLTGSMGRRGNPYDNAKVESFMKTLKVEAAFTKGRLCRGETRDPRSHPEVRRPIPHYQGKGLPSEERRSGRHLWPTAG